MIIWDPCSKTCCGSSVQKRMCVCVGLLTINSTTCELVWALGQLWKKSMQHSWFSRFVNWRFISRKSQMNYLSAILLIWNDFLFSWVQFTWLFWRPYSPRSPVETKKNFRGNIDWNDMTKIVRACAEIAKERGLPVFAIQYYGECWSGLDAENTYNRYGPSENCWNGVGKERTNYVYKIRVKVPVFVETEGLNIWHNNP